MSFTRGEINRNLRTFSRTRLFYCGSDSDAVFQQISTMKEHLGEMREGTHLDTDARKVAAS